MGCPDARRVRKDKERQRLSGLEGSKAEEDTPGIVPLNNRVRVGYVILSQSLLPCGVRPIDWLLNGVFFQAVASLNMPVCSYGLPCDEAGCTLRRCPDTDGHSERLRDESTVRSLLSFAIKFPYI